MRSRTTEGRSTGHHASVWTEVEGRRVHARVFADEAPAGARPVVLVHGLGASSRYLEPIAARLAVDYPVYAPDLPGFGKSERPPCALSVPGLADALAAWMAAVDLRRAALVGHSLGGQIVARLARQAPERVAHLVLVSPSGDPRVRSLLTWGIRVARDAPREPPALIALLARDYSRAGPLRTWHTARFMLRDQIDEALPLIRVPALVVRGERDPVVPHQWARQVAHLLPSSNLAEIPGAAHGVIYSAPEALAGIIRPFLAGVPVDTPHDRF